MSEKIDDYQVLNTRTNHLTVAEGTGHSYADYLRKLGYAGTIFQSALPISVNRNAPSGHRYVCF